MKDELRVLLMKEVVIREISIESIERAEGAVKRVVSAGLEKLERLGWASGDTKTIGIKLRKMPRGWVVLRVPLSRRSATSIDKLEQSDEATDAKLVIVDVVLDLEGSSIQNRLIVSLIGLNSRVKSCRDRAHVFIVVVVRIDQGRAKVPANLLQSLEESPLFPAAEAHRVRHAVLDHKLAVLDEDELDKLVKSSVGNVRLIAVILVSQ